MQSNRWSRLVLTCLVAVGACGRDLPPDAEMHPQLPLYPYAHSLGVQVHTEDNLTPDDGPRAASIRECIASARLESPIGADSRLANQDLLGTIEDGVISADGLIYVLDGTANNIKIFSPGGELAYTLGSAGSGPGEFRAARELAFAEDGRLVVVDGGQRSQLFVPAGLQGGPYRAADAVAIPQYINSALFTGSRLVAGGAYQVDSALVILDPDLSLVKMTGPQYHTDNVVVQWSLAENRLVPTPDGGLIQAYTALGELVVYGPDVEFQRALLVPDFRPIPRYAYLVDGRPASRADHSRSSDELLSLAWITDTTLLIQVGRSRIRNLTRRERDVAIRYYALTLPEYEVAYLGDDLITLENGQFPLIYDARGGSLLVGSNVPQPYLFLFEYGGCQ